MLNSINESDWKYLKKLYSDLLERACSQINLEATFLLKNTGNKNQYQIYNYIYEHYHENDQIISDCFDDHKRSTAKIKILNLVKYNIITDSELNGFSDDIIELVKKMIKK